jgi:hypothetical protein
VLGLVHCPSLVHPTQTPFWQIGVFPEHCAFDVHSTHCPVPGSHTGVAPLHWVGSFWHGTQVPLWQIGVVPEQSALEVHPTQTPPWQIGVGAEHWVFDVQGPHVPVATSQTFGAVHCVWFVVVHWTQVPCTGAVLHDSQPPLFVHEPEAHAIAHDVLAHFVLLQVAVVGQLTLTGSALEKELLQVAPGSQKMVHSELVHVLLQVDPAAQVMTQSSTLEHLTLQVEPGSQKTLQWSMLVHVKSAVLPPLASVHEDIESQRRPHVAPAVPVQSHEFPVVSVAGQAGRPEGASGPAGPPTRQIGVWPPHCASLVQTAAVASPPIASRNRIAAIAIPVRVLSSTMEPKIAERGRTALRLRRGVSNHHRTWAT